jgi:hypothetical protein
LNSRWTNLTSQIEKQRQGLRPGDFHFVFAGEGADKTVALKKGAR